MAITYKLIKKVSLSSGSQANIEFTAIPQTFINLILIGSTRITGNAGGMYLTFNDNASSYSGVRFGAYRSGNNNLRYSDNNASLTNKFFTVTSDSRSTADYFNTNEIYIANYSESYNKSLFLNGAKMDIDYSWINHEYNYGTWANSSPVTSIKIVPELGSFAQYTTMSLYGINNN